MLVALLLALLRLAEPIVCQTLRADLASWSCGAVGAAVDKDLLTDSLNSFLTSSLNLELVYTILEGIRRVAKEPAASETLRLELPHIEIRCPAQW